MEADAVLSLRVLATSVALLSDIFNSLVCYMVLFRTPKEYRNFSVLLGSFAAVYVISGTIGWSVVHQNEARVNQTVPVVSYGLCTVISPRFCYILDQFTFPMVTFELILTPFCMGYRLYVFLYRQLPIWALVLCLLALASPALYLLDFRLRWYVEPSVIAPAVSDLGRQYVYYGFYQPDTWQFELMAAMNFLPFVTCIVTLLLRQVLVYKINQLSRTISNRNYGLHRIFAWMLTIQALIPLFTALATLGMYYVRIDTTTHPILGSFSFVIMAISPILEAVTTLVCLPPYRRALKQMFCFKVETVSPQLTNEHHTPSAAIA